MPESARILPFPSRAPRREFSRADARAEAERLLSAAPIENLDATAERQEFIDILMAACALLRERIGSSPAAVAESAAALYDGVQNNSSELGLFDEREFLLGELAWLAGNACRLCGRREDVERWLDRADANFRHTVNPAPSLTRVSFARLSLRYDMRRYDEVLELLPSVGLSFEKLGMNLDHAKARYLEALALKESGRRESATLKLEGLTSDGSLEAEPGFLGMAFVNLGDLLAQASEFAKALSTYSRALSLLRMGNHSYAIAHLKASVGDTLRRQGQHLAAVEAFREAVAAYESIQMVTWSAHVRLVLAETLLEVGRPREPEWEILAALPTIENQKMVPEGFGALALLRESARQRKTDSKALGEVRQYLQANN